MAERPPIQQYPGPQAQAAYPPPPYNYPPQQPHQQMAPYPSQQPHQQMAPYPQQPPPVQYTSPKTIVMVQPKPQPPPTTMVVVPRATQPPVDSGTRSLATVSLIAAIIATMCCAGFLFTIPAIILAALALSESHARSAKTMAIVSCVLSAVTWVGYVVAIIWFIVASVSAANYVASSVDFSDRYNYDRYNYW